MGIVDYMSREPNGEPWPETYLDEKFVLASIECFHKALDYLSSRLNDTLNIKQNVNILEHSGFRDTLDELKDTSSNGCYSNRAVQKRTRLDRNKNGPNSSLSNCEPNTLSKFSHCKQSVDNTRKQEYLERKSRMEKKPKKTVKIVERERNRDLMLEQVTETTYRRMTTVQRRHESDSSEDDMPRVEWRKMDIVNQRRDSGQSTSLPTPSGTPQSEPKRLTSLWDLVGSERADKVVPGSLLVLEASTVMSSPQKNIPERNNVKVTEVDLTADSPISSPEISLVGGRNSDRKSREEELDKQNN